MVMVGKSAAATFFCFFLLNTLLFTSVCVSSHQAPCPPPPSQIQHGSGAKCPRDILKFGVCGSWLGLVREVVGTKPSPECCTLIHGLADLEAAVCLCTAIKADVLGALKVQVPIAISLLLNGCGKKIPRGFTC